MNQSCQVLIKEQKEKEGGESLKEQSGEEKEKEALFRPLVFPRILEHCWCVLDLTAERQLELVEDSSTGKLAAGHVSEPEFDCQDPPVKGRGGSVHLQQQKGGRQIPGLSGQAA